MKADHSYVFVQLYTELGYNLIYRVLLFKLQWYAYNRSGADGGEDPMSWEEFINVLQSSEPLKEMLKNIMEAAFKSYPESKILFGRKLKAKKTTRFPADKSGNVQVAKIYTDPKQVYQLIDDFTDRVVTRYYHEVFQPKHPRADEEAFFNALLKSGSMQNKIRRTIQICTSSLDYDQAWEDHTIAPV